MTHPTPPEPEAWMPIKTAPKDGTPIQARIPGHGEDNIIVWTDGLLDDLGDDCGGWAFATEQEPPECWTDGVCRAFNEDGVPSVQPTHWKPDPLDALAPPACHPTELVEALRSALKIIHGIDEYMTRPGRGDWGVECACCMGELLDDDRSTIASIEDALARSTNNG